MAKHIKDGFNCKWIREQTLLIVPKYELGVLTVRALYYRLVSIGYPNSKRHYDRVVDETGRMRRKNLIPYETFSDHDRNTLGSANIEKTNVYDGIASAESRIRDLLNGDSWNKNRWENQPYYIEIWVEKKALLGTLQSPCLSNGVMLCPSKGYASLTFLNEAGKRFERARRMGKIPKILYFGDYDASGKHIPKKIKQSLRTDFNCIVELDEILLNKQQVLDWKLPIAPSKKTDTRTSDFVANGGLGQVELDAVEPSIIQKFCREAIAAHFDDDLHAELMEKEEKERKIYELGLYGAARRIAAELDD